MRHKREPKPHHHFNVAAVPLLTQEEHPRHPAIACPLKQESTVRYLAIEVDDALGISEQTNI